MTAEEMYIDFWKEEPDGGTGEGQLELMIKFAKYHVEKALDAAYSNAKLNWNGIPSSATYTIEPYNTFYDSVTIAVDSNSIYHSYPLDNIK